MFYKQKINFLLVIFAFFCLAIPVLGGEQVPFKGTLTGQVVGVTPVDDSHLLFDVLLSGNATQLGKFTGEGQVIQNTEDGSYVGSYTWRAANGDTVSGTFVGQLIPTQTPGVFDNIETTLVTGGTGRFSGGVGSTTAGGQLDMTTGSFLFPFEGTISSVGQN